MAEKHVREELHNIALNAPLFAGDTISHSTANECVRRGWAKRGGEGRSKFIPTARGVQLDRSLWFRFLRLWRRVVNWWR